METYRIHDDASVYFVTFSVVSWLPVFVSERACRLLTDSLAFCHAQKGLRINAYVIMPTHLHAIVFDHEHDAARLTQSLNAFRRYTGRILADDAVKNQPHVFSEVFRQAAGPDRQRRFWQPTRHPIAVRTQSFWKQKLDYIHANPVRKGLVQYPEDWRFSSARYYATGDPEGNDVNITQMMW
jgi:REP element-mobilizing transposase RayT